MKKLIANIGVVAVAGMVSSAAQAADTLSIVSWGGAYTESQTKAYHEPWTKKTGDKIINVDKS